MFHFWNLHQILNIVKEKMIVIANGFPILQTVKNLPGPLSKNRPFRTGFDSQHMKASQILATSLWERFYDVFSWFSTNLIWKMSPLVLGELLMVFVNTLIADDQYPVQDWKNLQLLIQMHLSEKRKKKFSIFSSISRIYIKFAAFSQKGWS